MYDEEMGIFEGYMGEQFREGEVAFKKGTPLSHNPYYLSDGSSPTLEAAKAWVDGWVEASNCTTLSQGTKLSEYFCYKARVSNDPYWLCVVWNWLSEVLEEVGL